MRNNDQTPQFVKPASLRVPKVYVVQKCARIMYKYVHSERISKQNPLLDQSEPYPKSVCHVQICTFTSINPIFNGVIPVINFHTRCTFVYILRGQTRRVFCSTKSSDFMSEINTDLKMTTRVVTKTVSHKETSIERNLRVIEEIMEWSENADFTVSTGCPRKNGRVICCEDCPMNIPGRMRGTTDCIELELINLAKKFKNRRVKTLP